MKKSLRKLIAIITFIVLSISLVAATGVLASASSNTTSFIGRDLNGEDLESASNTSIDEQGNYTTPVSDYSPQVTFLIPGFGSEASVWSNNYYNGMPYNNNEEKNESLAYNSKSLLEKLRSRADADVYVAKITTEYVDEKKVYSTPFGDEIRPAVSELEFTLYSYPEFGTSTFDQYCFETEKEVFDASRAATVSQLTEANNHIIILFEPEDATGSNQQIYEQFNYVADSIVYDLKVINGGELPKVNLIAHSRGGLTAMQYALDHPFLVESMITIGTPFLGSQLGSSEDVLSMLSMSADRSNPNFSYGVEDILNKSLYEGMLNRWNNNYEDLYRGIHFVAIGTGFSSDFLTSMLSSAFLSDSTTAENYAIDSYSTREDLAKKAARLWKFIHAIDSVLEVFYSEGNICNDDLFIHLESQLAEGYEGVTRLEHYYDGTNADFDMVATSNFPIPHNLEPGDAKIHSMILSQLHFSNAIYDYHIENNYITIDSINRRQHSGVLAIPETIDGITVKKIGDYAFSNLDIESVVLPKRLEEIGDYAFYSCKNLTSISFESTSDLTGIGEHAFEDCISLSDFVIPDGCHWVCDYAFANTNISRAYVNIGIEYYASTAFYGAPIEEYYQTAPPAKYAAIDGVLYDVRLNRIVAYPSHSTATSFTMPSDITLMEDYAFATAENLVSVDLANVTSISDGAFYKCTNLLNITGDNVLSVGYNALSDTAFINRDAEIISIGKVLVRYNTNEQAVTVEDYEYISSGAFSSCPNMETVILAGDIKTIGDFAFYNSDALRTVYLKTNAVVDIGQMSFCIPVIDAIYVPSIKYEEYIASDELGLLSELYAKHTTAVTFDSNGGETIPNAGFEYYSYIVLPTPIRNRYDFMGWYGVVDGQERLVENGETWLSLAESITLTAHWRPTEYTIVINPDGSGGEDSNVSIEDGALAVPTKTGYSFVGWYTGENQTGVQVTDSNGVLLIGFDELLEYGEIYAGWTPITYTVTYVLNGGTNNSSNPVSFTIESEAFTLLEPTRGTYYRFDGWYESPTFEQSTELTVIPAGSSRNITLYANWIRLYTIQFDGAASSADKYQYAAIGDAVTTPNIRDGYVYIVEGERVGAGYTFILESEMLVNEKLVIERKDKTLDELYDAAGDYYPIYTAVQFYSIGESTHSTSGNTYILMNNIAVSSTYGTYINVFRGTLDGNGKSISGVRVDLDADDIGAGNYGLVKTNRGTIKNLTITSLELDVSAPSTDTGEWVMVGFIAGENYGTISNVTVKNCDMIAGRHTMCMGGIVGNNCGTVENCYAQNLTIVGCCNLGGIAGANYGSGIIRYCYTSGCTFTVNVNTVNRATGGICGYSWENALIEYCRVTSTTITVGTYNLADNAVQPMIGKVVGYVQNSTMRNVGAISTTIDSTALPDPTYTLWWVSFDPEAYVGKADAYLICGRNDGGAISNIQWVS